MEQGSDNQSPQAQGQQAQKQQNPPIDNPPNQSDHQTGNKTSDQSDSSPNRNSEQKNDKKPDKKRSFWGANAKSWRIPKINLANIKIPSISFRRSPSAKPRNWLLLWLLVIMLSYVCMGYFLSVLMTIPNRQILAIAGFTIVGMLPIVTAFADYGLMKWGYLISGLLVVGAFIFWLRMRFYLIVLAMVIWIGITMVAFVGEYLLKQKRKFVVAIAMITVPCLVGLGIGWQLWNLAANHLS
jgi:hypothetical protein